MMKELMATEVRDQKNHSVRATVDGNQEQEHTKSEIYTFQSTNRNQQNRFSLLESSRLMKLGEDVDVQRLLRVNGGDTDKSLSRESHRVLTQHSKELLVSNYDKTNGSVQKDENQVDLIQI